MNTQTPHTLTLTSEQLGVIDQALGAMPYRAAAPVIDSINHQLAEAQERAAAERNEQRNRNRDETNALPPIPADGTSTSTNGDTQ